MAFTPCFQHLFGDYTVDNDISDEGWSKYGDAVDWLVIDEAADPTNSDLSYIVRVNTSDASDSFVAKEICTECTGDADDDVIVLIKIKESRAGSFLIGIDYDSDTNTGNAVALRPATNHFDLVRVSDLHTLSNLATSSFTFELNKWYCVRVRNNNGSLQAKIWLGHENESVSWAVEGVAGEVEEGESVDNTLWGWGCNNGGALGLNDVEFRSSPTQVGSLTIWSKVSNGYENALAIRSDGTLWSWGYNWLGELGVNDTEPRSSPIQVGSLTTWKDVLINTNSSVLAVKTDGTLWSWGYNGVGHLGQNNLISKSSPVQVGSLTTWDKIGISSWHCAAIKTDGTLWTWGSNYVGVQGKNDTIDRSSPVQVGSLTTWSEISLGASNCLAIQSDGTLWAWGYNGLGELGQNNRVNRSSPVQVGSLTTWSEIDVGSGYSFGIKTDGTLWGWGNNDYGCLGLNNMVYRSSPVQVGSLTTWNHVSASNSYYYFTYATRSNGTLWSWGYDGMYGCLGHGTSSWDRSSPVQIGSLTTWMNVVAGAKSGFALSGSGGDTSYYDQTYKMFLGQVNEVYVDIAAVAGCIHTPIDEEYYLPLISLNTGYGVITYPVFTIDGLVWNIGRGEITFPEFIVSTDSHMVSGFITLDGSTVERTVRLYNRNTGILLGETLSDSIDGSYYIRLSSDDECFVVVLDDNLNALLADNITPVPIG